MKNWIWFNNSGTRGSLGTQHLPDEVVRQSIEFYITLSGPVDGDARRGGFVVGCLLNDGQDDRECLVNEERLYIAAALRMAATMVEEDDVILQGSDEHTTSIAL